MADQEAKSGARQRLLPEELRLSLPERAAIAKYRRRAADLAGKIWGAPNTAIGLAYGGRGTPLER